MIWEPPEHRVVEIPSGPSTIKGSSRSYLKRGLIICQGITEADNRTWVPAGHLNDVHGTYAYSANADDPKLSSFKLLLIARKYVMGNIVGAGQEVIERCIVEKRHLLIYIFQSNKIYVFDVKECKLNGKVSTRGFRTFYDFQIKLGVNLVKYLADLRGDRKKKGLDEFIQEDNK